MVDIIERKRNGEKLTKEEISFFVRGYVDGSIPDYQASALAMAIYFRGMDKEETAILTDAMMHSGDVVDLSNIAGVKVDKHSTGGVGDKTSLVVGPLVASYGVKVAKMSGRGLGHTGGTLDKMESIPGMRIALSEDEFVNQVNSIGLAIIGQTKKIVPADKKLYALRDVTATVESIPLISSSIMSKKLAAGTDAILLDVKYGRGAFMKTLDRARELARAMVEIGHAFGRDTRAVLSDMNQPLGKAVGNALEVKEAIATLQGHGPEDFVYLCVDAVGIMLEQAGVVKTREEGEELGRKAIANGQGFEKLCQMVEAQGGDVSYIRDPGKFPLARHIIPVISHHEGFVGHIDSLAIGIGAMKLGAGREKMDDVIEMSAGIVLEKKVGDYVAEGDVLCYLHTEKEDCNEVYHEVRHAFELVDNPIKPEPLIADYIK